MIIPLLCAVNPPHPSELPKRPVLMADYPPNDGSLPQYFYTSYHADGSHRQTLYGSKAYLEACRALDTFNGFRVSALIPDLPLSESLKYRYSWRNGQQTQELRREYRPAPALAGVQETAA